MRFSWSLLYYKFRLYLILRNTHYNRNFSFNQIIKLYNSNNNSDYNIILIYTWEELTPRPIITAIEPRSGNYLIVKIKRTNKTAYVILKSY